MDSRTIQFQENINRRVLLDWVRIVWLPNPRKKKYDSLLEELAHDILGYPRDRPTPFSWATSAGEHNHCQAIRARMTYDFWRHFRQDGRNTLAVYNRKNGFNINICREKTLSLQDMDRLGLYLRKRIHDEVRVKRLNGPKVTLVKGMLRVGDVVPMKPTIAAIKLNLDMSSWNGVPLLEMLTVKEKEALENTKCSSPTSLDKSERAKIRKRSGNHEEYTYPSKMKKKMPSWSYT